MKHLMIDLETMATSSDAVVVSLGAVFFDVREGLGREFYTIFDRNSQYKEGRKINPGTMDWWLQQSPEAREVFKQPKESTASALLRFNEFVSYESDDVYMWGNGADFDCVILGSLYDTFSIKRPWSYSNNRCYRTLKNLVHPGENLPAREGTHHNALDDARYQALCAIGYLKGNLRK